MDAAGKVVLVTGAARRVGRAIALELARAGSDVAIHYRTSADDASELAGLIPSYVMVKVKMPCPAGAAEKVASKTRKAFEGRGGAKFNASDGLRIDLPEGWVCVRASNTEPIMRIFAEAGDEETAGKLVDEVRRIAESIIN